MDWFGTRPVQRAAEICGFLTDPRIWPRPGSPAEREVDVPA